jgi:hypothetical protein
LPGSNTIASDHATYLKIAPDIAKAVRLDPHDVLPQGHPAKGKTMQNVQPTAYVCQRTTCSAPIVNPVTLSQVLQLPLRPQGQA